MMMPPDNPHSAGLRSLLAHFFNKRNFAIQVKLIKLATQHRVAMKVDASTVVGFDESVVLQRKQLGHFSVRVGGGYAKVRVTESLGRSRSSARLPDCKP